jgi:hypothetical protein
VTNGKKLSAYFGNDLKGLVPIRNFKAVVRMGNVDTPINKVNLSSTDSMLARLAQIAPLTTVPVNSAIRIRRRRTSFWSRSSGLISVCIGVEHVDRNDGKDANNHPDDETDNDQMDFVHVAPPQALVLATSSCPT